ncbi:MAG: hypothetical protein PVI23_12115, partial [Maricaulaceae bacterium]
MTHASNHARQDDASLDSARRAGARDVGASDWADTKGGARTLAALAWCGYFAFAAFLTFHDVPDADASVPLAGLRAATEASITPPDRSAIASSQIGDQTGARVAPPTVAPDRTAQEETRSLRPPVQGV